MISVAMNYTEGSWFAFLFFSRKWYCLSKRSWWKWKKKKRFAKPDFFWLPKERKKWHPVSAVISLLSQNYEIQILSVLLSELIGWCLFYFHTYPNIVFVLPFFLAYKTVLLLIIKIRWVFVLILSCHSHQIIVYF